MLAYPFRVYFGWLMIETHWLEVPNILYNTAVNFHVGLSDSRGAMKPVMEKNERLTVPELVPFKYVKTVD